MNSTVAIIESEDYNFTVTEFSTVVTSESLEPAYNVTEFDSNFTNDDVVIGSMDSPSIYMNNDISSYAIPMYGYIMPFLLVITVVSNTLIVVVLSKRHMKTPTNLVLLAMALSDMFTLLFPAPWMFYMYTLGNINETKRHYPLAACYCYLYMQEVLPSLFHTASIWLTLALAVQRYIYVCLPPVARTWCTIPRVKRGIFYIYICASLHQSTRFVDRVYTDEMPLPSDFNITDNATLAEFLNYTNASISMCHEKLAPWVELVTDNVYFNIYFWFRIIFVHVTPCTMLVVLNVLLFRAMREAQKKRERLFKENRKSECKKLRDSNCTTLMLIVVVSVFLVVEIPLAVVTLLHTISSTFKSHLLDYYAANVLILFTNFFIMLSYPINFAIYCGMSRQFRETFKELFIGGGISPAKRDGSSRYSLVNGPKTSTNETVL
ncbi:hypothetical protein CHUAL_001723 [Chamberlinius hualienensis]